MRRNFIVSGQTRTHQRLSPKARYPRTKDQIHLYSEKLCINIKVNVTIPCIGGDIPVHEQLENTYTSLVQ